MYFKNLLAFNFLIKSFSKSLLLRYIKAQTFSMRDSLLFNLDSLAGFYQGFIVCGEKSRVAKGDKLPGRGGGGSGGMFPEKFVK